MSRFKVQITATRSFEIQAETPEEAEIKAYALFDAAPNSEWNTDFVKKDNDDEN